MARGLGFRVPRLIPANLLPKKRLIPFVDNSTLAIGTGVGILALYYAQTQGLVDIPVVREIVGIVGGAPGPTAGGLSTGGNVVTNAGNQTGNRVSFVVSPNIVQPDSQILITGNVTDSNGVPAKPANLYYYIYQDLSAEGGGEGLTKLVVSGNLGSLVSEFRRPVSTAGFRPGDYLVAVADEQLPGTGQVVAGSTDIAGQAPPLTTNTIQPNEFGNITLS